MRAAREAALLVNLLNTRTIAALTSLALLKGEGTGNYEESPRMAHLYTYHEIRIEVRREKSGKLTTMFRKNGRILRELKRAHVK